MGSMLPYIAYRDPMGMDNLWDYIMIWDINYIQLLYKLGYS